MNRTSSVKTVDKGLVFVGSDASRTGAPIMLLQFLKWMRENTTVPFEVLLTNGGPLLSEYKAAARTRVLWGDIIPSPARGTLGRIIDRISPRESLQKQLQRLYPKQAFPIVYSNTIANSVVVDAFTAAGRDVICHVHEMRVAIQRWGGPDVREHHRAVDLFVAASAAVKHDLKQTLNIPDSRIHVVHEFAPPLKMDAVAAAKARMDIRRKLECPSHSIVVGMCGTSDWRKGIDLFPQLAKVVNELDDSRQYRFVWIGFNSSEIELRQLRRDCEQLGVHDIVRIIPVVENSQDYLAALDIFALTSREDPFPLAMLEAGALGIPLVCFDGAGGAPELVGSDAGLCVPYLDIRSMATSVVRLANAPELRNQLGSNLSDKVQKHFTIHSQAPKLLQLILSRLPANAMQTYPHCG